MVLGGEAGGGNPSAREPSTTSGARGRVPLAYLRWRLQRVIPGLRDWSVEVRGAARPFVVCAPADPEAVLDAVGRAYVGRAVERAWHMPYWATVWASGIAAAEAIVAEEIAVRGRRVLELGCGLGVTAMALANGGANLVVTDCFSETLVFCRYNVMRHVPTAVVRTIVADWQTPAGQSLLEAHAPFDTIVAADILYEREDVAPLRDLVPRLLARSGELWIAEPGRDASRDFLTAMMNDGWSCATGSRYRAAWPADAGPATVRLHRLTGMK